MPLFTDTEVQRYALNMGLRTEFVEAVKNRSYYFHGFLHKVQQKILKPM